MNTTKKTIVRIVSFLVVLCMPVLAFAQGTGADQTKLEGLSRSYGELGLAAGLAIGIAALGGGIGQGRAAAAALDGIARNPGAAGQLGSRMILGLALIESLVIYALIIAFLLVGKIG